MTSFVAKRNQVNFQSLDDPDFLCGWGPIKSAWLQRMANPKVFLVFYCALGILQGAYFTYSVGIISTIEKRFAFDSKASGLILIADNLSPIFTSLLIGYYGGSAHRPRIIGFGMLTVVVSCFISATPYFLYGPGLHLLNKEVGGEMHNKSMCLPSEGELGHDENYDNAESHQSSSALTAVVLFFIGSFFSGFGGSAYYTAGIAYMDDSVKKENSAGYFSLSMAIRLFGPSLGFALSSFCLRYFEAPTLFPNIEREDPRWVGAWWLGFVILGVFLFIFSLPMFFFPRRLKREPVESKSEEKKDSEMPKLKDMPKSLFKLMKNAMFVCHTLGLVFHLNGLLGYFILMPRYMEHHFRKSASDASIISGSTSIISMLVGIFVGGHVIKRYKPRPRILTGYMVFVHVFTIAVFLVLMLLACEPTKMAHPQLPDGSLLLTNACNDNCGCTTKVFQPVCDVDSGTSFFSPCHAGCTGMEALVNSSEIIFTGCRCDTENSLNQELVEGLCPFFCNMFFYYIIIGATAKLVSSTGRVGNMLITLRCIDAKDKTLALGVLGCAMSLLAFIPHPLIFGALADTSCKVWEESNGTTGNCWLYDVDKLRYVMHGACVAFMAAGTACDFVVFLLSGRLKDFYHDVPQEDPDKITVNGKEFVSPVVYKDVDREEDEVVLFTNPKVSMGNSYNKLSSGI